MSRILFTLALLTFLTCGPVHAAPPQVVPVGQTCDPNTAASFMEQSAECTGTAFQRPAFQFGAAVAACAAGTAGMVQWTGAAKEASRPSGNAPSREDNQTAIRLAWFRNSGLPPHAVKARPCGR